MQPPSLTTERLLLRPMTPDDATALAEKIFGDPDIGWRYGLVAEIETAEAQYRTALEWIEDANAHWEPAQGTKGGWGGWATCPRTDDWAPKGELIGFCGFFTPDPPADDHELAYGVAKPFWGRGIATEAARACLRYLFVELGAARADTVAHPTVNLGSSRVLEKVGLDFLGRVDYRGSVAAGDGLLNHYGVERAVWLARFGASQSRSEGSPV